jgi:hypothetical protein
VNGLKIQLGKFQRPSAFDTSPCLAAAGSRGMSVNGTVLKADDGAAASQEEILEFEAVEDAEMLLFDLASNNGRSASGR